MKIVKGIVQQISIKDRQTGKYGDFAKYGIKVNDEWHNGLANADKNTGEIFVKDKKYNVVSEGDEVEFIVKEKNGYETIDNKDFEKKNVSTQQQTEQTPQPTKQPTKVPMSNLAVYMNCLDCAVTLATGVTFKVGDGDPVKFTSDQVLKIADTFYKKATNHEYEV